MKQAMLYNTYPSYLHIIHARLSYQLYCLSHQIAERPCRILAVFFDIVIVENGLLAMIQLVTHRVPKLVFRRRAPDEYQ